MIQRETTEELLMKSILQLMESRPLANVSVLDICNNCNLSKTTFYKNFRDKYDLVEHVYRADVQPLVDKIEEDESYTWRDMLTDAGETSKAHRSFYQNAYQDQREQNSLAETAAEIDVECALRIIAHRDPLFHADEQKMFALKAYIKGYRQLEVEMLASGQDFDTDTVVGYILSCMPEVVREVLL